MDTPEPSPLPRLPLPHPGETLPTLRVEIARADLIRYAGAADDYAYQHWDQDRMRSLGFADVVAHGWLTFAHMCRAVTDWMSPERADIAAYAVRYLQPVFPGACECGGAVAAVRRRGDQDLVDLELWAKDAVGQVTTTATMTLRLVA